MFGFFIKGFSEKCWADNFLRHGEMLFSRFDVMREIEDTTRKDEREGNTVESKNVIIDKNVKQINLGERFYVDLEKAAANGIDIRGKEVNLRITYIPDMFLYSITNVNEFMPESDVIFNEIKKFGSYGVVIYKCDEFIKRIKARISNIEYGAITYTDNPQNMYEKISVYKNESEVRFSFHEKTYENKIKKYIGSLEDIAFQCNTNHYDSLARQMRLVKELRGKNDRP